MNFAIPLIEPLFFITLKSRVVFAMWTSLFINKLVESVLRTSFVCVSLYIIMLLLGIYFEYLQFCEYSF